MNIQNYKKLCLKTCVFLLSLKMRNASKKLKIRDFFFFCRKRRYNKAQLKVKIEGKIDICHLKAWDDTFDVLSQLFTSS